MILTTTYAWCYEVSVVVVDVVVVCMYTHCQCIVSSHCSGDVLESTAHRVRLVYT